VKLQSAWDKRVVLSSGDFRQVYLAPDEPFEFVEKWPHLGHITSVTGDDKADIMSKRSALCQQINNVSCAFFVYQLSLMKTYCRSFYGAVLRDRSNVSIRDVCVVWRKGLRRTWDLPHNTHCNLLPLLCDVLPLMDELSCRCAKFIANALDSDSDVVSYVTRHGAYTKVGCNVVADWPKCIFMLLEI